PHKPSANVTNGAGRHYTISIALPSSIVNNAQTWELKTALVGQIARACAIFSVDEIIIFEETLPDDSATAPPTYGRGKYRDVDEGQQSEEPFQPGQFMARILEYLECPQYLRKSLFPLHPDLRLAGLLPPLDLPHHFRRDHQTPWREGCVLPREKADNYLAGNKPNKKKKDGQSPTVWVDVGLAEPVEVKLEHGVYVPEWTRVTVNMPSTPARLARIVSPRQPTETSGTYWGYSVRLASSISKVFTESPYLKTGGYDLTIGTSERGQNITEAVLVKLSKICVFTFQTLMTILTVYLLDCGVSNHRHLLLAFGGLSGLELCIASDETLIPNLSAEDASLLFDHWVNTLPHQGSRTVRTEEALLVSLGAMRSLFLRS
ncbi:putative RNA methyltransferase, partial [Melampsora americana]